MSKLEAFTRHGETGVEVLDKDYLKWLETHSPSELGSKIVAYSWIVDGRKLMAQIDIANCIWQELPDASGFICIESEWRPDNCVLLNAYGEERMRLTVPWQLTRELNPESAKPPTSFMRVSAPFINPETSLRGEFGVIAWVEHAGTYYFELDYHAGEFLWGREIRD
ncbi:hypothetical protein PGB34_17750 [Xenophilus arseniciresistens]|uniref:Uncharacterized protein n=1 Tax=Xenophilus arseniciresistens TaxID=1283306 RepID=A0AAE3NBL5_9BURK|nr:hypothetical protein [Xenophilus arseniciresistens]MDA7418213.1 hypothetical protein [Xenophilus arseniciresistens]